MEPDLYAYRYPSGDDPHEIRLHIGRTSDHLPTTWELVYDHISTKMWYIRAAECDAECRCAAEAFCPDSTFTPMTSRPTTDQKGATKVTDKRPKTLCITCAKMTNWWHNFFMDPTGFDMGICPDCVEGPVPNRLGSDAEVTEDGSYPDCEVCGDPIDYCQGHGEIASSM